MAVFRQRGYFSEKVPVKLASFYNSPCYMNSGHQRNTVGADPDCFDVILTALRRSKHMHPTINVQCLTRNVVSVFGC